MNTGENKMAPLSEFTVTETIHKPQEQAVEPLKWERDPVHGIEGTAINPEVMGKLRKTFGKHSFAVSGNIHLSEHPLSTEDGFVISEVALVSGVNDAAQDRDFINVWSGARADHPFDHLLRKEKLTDGAPHGSIGANAEAVDAKLAAKQETMNIASSVYMDKVRQMPGMNVVLTELQKMVDAGEFNSLSDALAASASDRQFFRKRMFIKLASEQYEAFTAHNVKRPSSDVQEAQAIAGALGLSPSPARLNVNLEGPAKDDSDTVKRFYDIIGRDQFDVSSEASLARRMQAVRHQRVHDRFSGNGDRFSVEFKPTPQPGEKKDE